MLKDAYTLREQFNIWKNGKDDGASKSSYKYKEQLPKQPPKGAKPEKAAGATKDAEPAEVVYIDTLKNWLKEWGWTVGRSAYYYKQSYKDKNGELRAVHITLPKDFSDTQKDITAHAAGEIWVERKVHITMEEGEGGSDYNPRIFYEDGWKKSKGITIPAWGDAWLMTIAPKITTEAGFIGNITK